MIPMATCFSSSLDHDRRGRIAEVMVLYISTYHCTDTVIRYVV